MCVIWATSMFKYFSSAIVIFLTANVTILIEYLALKTKFYGGIYNPEIKDEHMHTQTCICMHTPDHKLAVKGSTALAEQGQEVKAAI